MSGALPTQGCVPCPGLTADAPLRELENYQFQLEPVPTKLTALSEPLGKTVSKRLSYADSPLPVERARDLSAPK